MDATVIGRMQRVLRWATHAGLWGVLVVFMLGPMLRPGLPLPGGTVVPLLYAFAAVAGGAGGTLLALEMVTRPARRHSLLALVGLGVGAGTIVAFALVQRGVAARAEVAQLVRRWDQLETLQEVMLARVGPAGQLPKWTAWMAVLREDPVAREILRVGWREGYQDGYAFNVQVAGRSVNELPPKTVLFFEVTRPSGSAGDKDLFTEALAETVPLYAVRLDGRPTAVGADGLPSGKLIWDPARERARQRDPNMLP